MYIFWDALTGCVRIADRLVFGEKNLTKMQIDLRTLACFVGYMIALLAGLGAVSSMQSDIALFLVWLAISAPMACVFIARHQRGGR